MKSINRADLRQIEPTGTPDCAIEISDWARGVRIEVDKRTANLVETIRWSEDNGHFQLARHARLKLAELRAARAVTEMDSESLARAYEKTHSRSPRVAERLTEIGRLDREHAERIVWTLVDAMTAAAEAA